MRLFLSALKESVSYSVQTEMDFFLVLGLRLGWGTVLSCLTLRPNSFYPVSSPQALDLTVWWKPAGKSC